MKKISNYFSYSFYKDTLLRVRIPMIIGICLMTLSSVSSAMTLLLSYLLSGSSAIDYAIAVEFFDINSSASAFVTVFMPVVTVIAYSFLTKRCDSDFYESLPVTRRAMLISGALALISASVVILLVSTAVPLLILIPCYGKTVILSFGRVLLSLLACILGSILAVLAALVAVSVTGKISDAIVVSFMLLCAPRLIMGMINLTLELLNPMLVSNHVIPFFNNEYNLFTALIMDNHAALYSVWPYLYSIVLAAVYFAAAFYLFKIRKSEYATHSFANKYIHHITKITLCTIFVLLGVLILAIDRYMIIISVFLFFLAIGLYFISSVLEARKEKNFISSLKAFPIFILTNAILIVFIVISNLILSSYSPTKDEISSTSVVVSDDRYYYYYDGYVDLRSENIEITDETVRDIVAKALERGADVDTVYLYNQITMKINTKSGTAYRNLYLTDDEYAEINIARSLDDDYEKLWMDISTGAESVSVSCDDGITISGDAANSILSTMQSEINEVGFANWYSYYMYEQPVTYISYTVYRNGKTLYVDIPVPQSLTETVEKFKEEYAKAKNEAHNHLKDTLYGALTDSDGVEIYLYYWAEKDYYTIDAVISDSNADSQKIVDGFLSLISLDMSDYDDYTITVNCYSNDLSTEDIYIEYTLKEGVTESQVVEFFKTYGYSY